MPRIAFRVIMLAGMTALTACGGGSKEVADRYKPVQLEQAASMRVNGYLWQAALETLNFMPIASTDATGGVIVTAPDGTSTFSFNTPGMYRGRATSDGEKYVAIYGDE